MFSAIDWHDRFAQQAGWTTQLRHYIYDRVSLTSAKSIIDVGCGTGVLEPELISGASINLIALDIDFHRLIFARAQSCANWLCGDIHSLPFADCSFDISLCHYLLLWLKDPVHALAEMRRITRPGGYILLLSEPDYTHRIDFPEELVILGKLQREALIKQGANPDIGPSIAGLLNEAGIEVVEVGLSGGQWTPDNSNHASNLEWKTLEIDLSSFPDQNLLHRSKHLDLSSRKVGTRILYVPVFYAIGKIPG